MQFTRKLHERIIAGEITSSIRIWQQPRVKVGGRYRLGEGAVEVESLSQISLADVTPAIAKASGFLDVDDLLKTAKHGKGDQVFLVEFRYMENPED